MSPKVILAAVLVGFVRAIAFAVVWALAATMLPIPGLLENTVVTTVILVLVGGAFSGLEAYMVKHDVSRIGPVRRMVGRGRPGSMTIALVVGAFALGLTWTLLGV